MPLGHYNSAAIINDGSKLVAAGGASVTVRKESDGSLANIFSDRDGNSALGNPFTADSNVRFEFYAEGLEEGFEITVSKDGDSYTLNNQNVDIERYSEMSIPMLYEPETDLTFYDGLVKGQPFSLVGISIYAATAPDSDMTVEVLKDGSATGTTGTLSGGSNTEKTTFATPVDFSATERMGFKVASVGSGDPGNDFYVTPHYHFGGS